MHVQNINTTRYWTIIDYHYHFILFGNHIYITSTVLYQLDICILCWLVSFVECNDCCSFKENLSKHRASSFFVIKEILSKHRLIFSYLKKSFFTISRWFGVREGRIGFGIWRRFLPNFPPFFCRLFAGPFIVVKRCFISCVLDRYPTRSYGLRKKKGNICTTRDVICRPSTSLRVVVGSILEQNKSRYTIAYSGRIDFGHNWGRLRLLWKKVR